MTALHNAVLRNDIPQIRRLLQRQQTVVGALDEHGRTAMDLALRAHNEPVVRMLVRAGAALPPASDDEIVGRIRRQQAQRAALVRDRYEQKIAMAPSKRKAVDIPGLPQEFRKRMRRNTQELRRAADVAAMLPTALSPDAFDQLMAVIDPAHVTQQEKQALVRFINQNSMGGQAVTRQSLATMDRDRLEGWIRRFRRDG